MQFTKVLGAQTVVMDVNQTRLDFCLDKMEVDGVINASGADPEESLRGLFGGDLPTVVFDATGNPNSMMGSFRYPAHGGKLVFIGLFQGDVTFHDPAFHKKELTLYASRNAMSRDFDEIIRLIESGKVDTPPWITHRAKMEQVPEIFDSWTKPQTGVIKAMIEVA